MGHRPGCGRPANRPRRCLTIRSCRDEGASYRRDRGTATVMVPALSWSRRSIAVRVTAGSTSASRRSGSQSEGSDCVGIVSAKAGLRLASANEQKLVTHAGGQVKPGKAQDEVLSDFVAAASGIVAAEGREPWDYGWCSESYRRSGNAAMTGPAGSAYRLAAEFFVKLAACLLRDSVRRGVGLIRAARRVVCPGDRFVARLPRYDSGAPSQRRR